MKKIILFLVVIFISGMSLSAQKTTQVVEFLAVGDNIIHEAVLNDAKIGNEYNFEKMYSSVADIIKKADISFINQETICSNHSPSGYPLFSTPDSIVRDLKNVGFDVVNIANNHMLDMDTVKTGGGYAHSIELWENSGMTLVGGYMTEQEAHRGKTIVKKGIKIMFLSYTYGTNVTLDKNENPYVPYMDENSIINDLKKSREVADFVILSLHWGQENEKEPTEEQRRLAKVFSEAGADVILGHHSHILQQTEWIKTDRGMSFVAYSLGNFLSAQTNCENLVGGMLKFNIIKEKSGTRVDNPTFIPTVCHYIQDESKQINARKNIRIFPLDLYTKDMCREHGANEYGKFDIKSLYDNCIRTHLSISFGK